MIFLKCYHVFQKNKELILLLLLFMFALAFRIILFRYRFAIGFDEPHYLQLAVSARLDGIKEILHPFWPPGFPLLIMLFNFVTKDAELAGRMVSVMMGSAVIFPIFFLTKWLTNGKIALISTLLIAVNPVLAFLNTSILVESSFMTLSLIGLAVSWKAIQKKSLICGALAGILWGLSYLTRPDGIGFLILFFVFILMILIFNRMHQPIKNLLILIVCGLSFFLVSIPYLVYLHQQMGKWSLSLKWEVGRYDMDKFRSLSSDNQWLPVDMAWHLGNFHKLHELPDFQQQSQINHYLMLKEKIVNFYKALNMYIPNLLSSLLLILCVFGFFQADYTTEKIWLTLLVSLVLLFFWFVVVPLFHVNDRYLIPVMPLAFIWIGNGVYKFYCWLEEKIKHCWKAISNRGVFRLAAVVIIIVLVFFLSYLPELGKIVIRDKHSVELWADSIEQKKAGKWLRDRETHPPIIMSQNHSIDFYAGNYDIRTSVNIPRNKWEQVLAYARHRGAEYLVLNERYCDQWYPDLSFLLREENIPSELKLVYKDVDPKSGLKLVIYQIF